MAKAKLNALLKAYSSHPEKIKQGERQKGQTPSGQQKTEHHLLKTPKNKMEDSGHTLQESESSQQRTQCCPAHSGLSQKSTLSTEVVMIHMSLGSTRNQEIELNFNSI
jgi:hypothetical protein